MFKLRPYLVLVLCLILLAGGRQLVQAEEELLGAKDQAFLLDLARRTLSRYLEDGATPAVEEGGVSEALLKKQACFVTLNKRRSGLRGCMGLFERRRPLYENVIDRAIAAASKDPRFPRVRLNELKDIKIEISVLTEPQRLSFSSPQDLLSQLRPLIDGVILETRFGASTYLPQVWEQLSNKEQFLGRLCRKHGAPSQAWKGDDVVVSTYQAIVFAEERYGGR